MVNLLRLLPWHTDVELKEEDDKPEVLTEQERQKRLQGLREHVQRLRQDNSDRAALQVRVRRPRWTSDPPSKAGLYFIRRGPGFPTRVADVYSDRYGTWFFEWSDLRPQPVRGAGIEFSDIPISEPLP